jgi:phosphinothricin acetyltransferase
VFLIQDLTPEYYVQVLNLYNFYIRNTPATFDIKEHRLEDRISWFQQFKQGTRYQYLIAVDGQKVAGIVFTVKFRDKMAYETSVETGIYCSPDFAGKGLGQKLYDALFERLAGHDINRIYASITLPNERSIKLHERNGFKRIGVLTGVGRKFGKFWDVSYYEKDFNK